MNPPWPVLRPAGERQDCAEAIVTSAAAYSHDYDKRKHDKEELNRRLPLPVTGTMLAVLQY